MGAYTVYITPLARMEIKALPGNVRQRVKRAIDALAGNPHPVRSLVLDVPSRNVNCAGSGWIDGVSCMR